MAYETLITTTEVARHLADPNWAIVDCRFALDDTEQGRRAYQEAHIPGAVYAHLDEDLSGPIVPDQTGRHPLPDVETFADTLSAWGIGNDSQVVAYDDRGGAIAARLWWMLRWVGHDAVAVLDGGWPRWRDQARPTRSGVERPVVADFIPHSRPHLLVSGQEVAERLGDPALLLVDARSPDRFRGENETLDAVAGHIPGAVNAFYGRNLDEEGGFLPAAELRRRYRTLLDDKGPEQAVVYCGSGVTAAHDLLALRHAGLGDAILYAGSWSEWITDPERPVATQ